MSVFTDAMTTKDVLTENGMPTHSTSGKALVDLFFSQGASRNRDDKDIIRMFVRAFGENRELAMRSLFYARDIRGGQGERRFFRVVFRWVAENYPDIARKNISCIPEYGRWDDVLHVSVGTPIQDSALDFYENALVYEENGLAGKWAPREGKATHDLYKALRDHMGVTPKQYRKLVVGLSDTVEDKMCANQWGEINYNHVPSQAARIYSDAFLRHDRKRYASYLKAIQDPDRDDVKINANAIFPHEVAKKAITGRVFSSQRQRINAQWDSLPNYVPEGQQVIPVCDVSGSMNGTPMNVSVALGLYLAQRNKGPYRNEVVTFSRTPQFHSLKSDNVVDQLQEIRRIDWSMNTDFELLFKIILERAKENNLSDEDLPSKIIVFSDMQFDRARRGANKTGFEMVSDMYEKSQYTMPQLIFWNLRDSHGKPVKYHETGTALVSGFSPSIMTHVLSTENMTPSAIVLKTLQDSRYDCVTV